MKMFESFNFDIIIILILISSTISGLYFNLYRQGRRTLVLISPIIILFFSYNIFYDIFKSIGFLNDAIENVINLFKIIKYFEYAYSLIIYIFSYFILALFVRVIYGLFRVPVQKRVLNKSSVSSRILSSILGLFSGYVIGMLFMFILNPFIGLNYDKPITKIYTETSNDVLTFSSLNQLQNVNVKKYNEYETVIGEFTGRNALNKYYDILEVFDNFENFETEFDNDLIPNLTDASKALILDDSVLNSFSLNSNIILENEKGKEILNRLKEINTFINTNKVYLKVYNSVTNHDYITISSYLIINYDELILEINNELIRDVFTNTVSIFKNYKENKDKFFSLFNYESTNIEDDVLYLEKQLNSKTESLISNFNNTFATKDTDLLRELENIFILYNQNKEKILKLNPNLSLSVKLTLSERFNYYFDNKSIINNKLLKSYISDSITNIDTDGYRMYSEYIFYIALVEDINIEELSLDEFMIILSNLEKLVNDEIFTKDQAKDYFKNIFSSDSKYFYGLLNEDLITEIKNIDNEYLSEELYTLLR